MSDSALPTGWSDEELSARVERLDSGVSVNSDDKPCGADEFGILKTSCVNGGKFDPRENKVIPAAEIRRATLNPKADAILISRMNTFDLVGESAYVGRDFPNLFVPDRLWQTVIRSEPKTFTKWLSFVVQSPKFRAAVSNAATGTSGSMKNISQRSYLAIRIQAPPIPEQQQIAEILSTVDEAIGHTEALVGKWQQMKAGLMHDLFTRGVTADGQLRPTHTQAPKLYQNSPLGWVPKDWEVDTIGAIFTRRMERGIAGLPIMSIIMSGGMVRRDSTDRRVESNLTPEAHLLVRRGDIAYNMMRMWQGVLGRAEYDGLVSPAYIVMAPTPRIDSVFAEYLLSTKTSIAWFKRRSYGVVDDRLRLYAHDLMRIPLAIPRSVTEQTAIAERLQALDTSIRETRTSLAKLRQQKQGLMHDLLTGRVRASSVASASIR